MLRNLVIMGMAALALAVPNASGQQWLANLPRESAKELTFQDYKQAFDEYYKQHPVPMEKENIKPTFRFETAEEINDKVAIEEYKLFKSWEWLMEPRTYPDGRLNMAAISEIRERAPKKTISCC